MKRKNILLLIQIIVALFLLLLSPVFAQNSYVISLDGTISFGVQDGSNILDVSTAWTFEAWINVGGDTTPGDEDCIMDRRQTFSFYLIDKGSGSLGDYAITFAARDNDDINIASLTSDGTGTYSETQMDFDTWYHVAATYNGTTARLYINSTETDANTDADWALTASGYGITIGGKVAFPIHSWVQLMSNTDIDEIRMSDVARAIGDMQTTINSHPYSSDGNTIFLMHLDDQAVPPTFDTGVGFTGLKFHNGGLSSDDYVLSSGLPLGPGILADIKVFLEGPYSGGGEMTTSLNSIIPFNSNDAYSTTVYDYTASIVGAIPNADIVDWVLVELRNGTASGDKVGTRAAFLKSDGTIVDVDGTSQVTFTDLPDGDYYIVIRHRNHLAIMSASAIPLSGSSALYDFTTSQSKAYTTGIDPMAVLTGSVYGMIAGDANTDGFVTSTDFNVFNPKFTSAASGYEYSDWNLDRFVTSTDFNYFNPNFTSAKQSFVP